VGNAAEQTEGARSVVVSPNRVLERMREVCKDGGEVDAKATARVNKSTDNGRNMEQYTALLEDAVAEIKAQSGNSDLNFELVSFVGG
jgi:hypothetical protein